MTIREEQKLNAIERAIAAIEAKLDGSSLFLEVTQSIIHEPVAQLSPDLSIACNGPRPNPRVVFINAHDPEHPSIIGSVRDEALLSGSFGHKFVGSSVHVACPSVNRMTIVNAGDPTLPRIEGSVINSGLISNNDVVKIGGRVYVIGPQFHILTTIDISDRAHPTVISSTPPFRDDVERCLQWDNDPGTWADLTDEINGVVPGGAPMFPDPPSAGDAMCFGKHDVWSELLAMCSLGANGIASQWQYWSADISDWVGLCAPSWEHFKSTVIYNLGLNVGNDLGENICLNPHDINWGKVALGDPDYSADTISFDSETQEIRDSANGMARFKTGHSITIAGTEFNNGTYTIATGNLPNKVVVVEALTDESAGGMVSITEAMYYIRLVVTDTVPTDPTYPVGDFRGADMVFYFDGEDWHDLTGSSYYQFIGPVPGSALYLGTIQHPQGILGYENYVEEDPGMRNGPGWGWERPTPDGLGWTEFWPTIDNSYGFTSRGSQWGPWMDLFWLGYWDEDPSQWPQTEVWGHLGYWKRVIVYSAPASVQVPVLGRAWEHCSPATVPSEHAPWDNFWVPVSSMMDGWSLKQISATKLISTGYARIVKWDISDHDNPVVDVELRDYDLLYAALGSDVVGNLIYIANFGNNELLIIDTDTMTVVGSLQDAENLPYPTDVKVVSYPGVGTFAFVSAAGLYVHSIVVVDVTDPAMPVIVASIGVGRSPMQLAVSRDKHYLFEIETNYFRVIAILDPYNPTQVAEIHNEGILSGAKGISLQT
jgi:hypothetical protein